jgi:hypothetical protein
MDIAATKLELMQQLMSIVDEKTLRKFSNGRKMLQKLVKE